jgi:hypothetical protein
MDFKAHIILQDAYKEYDIGMVQKMFPKYEDYPPPEPQVYKFFLSSFRQITTYSTAHCREKTGSNCNCNSSSRFISFGPCF